MEQLAQIDSPSGFSRAITIDRIDLYPLRASGGVSPSMALGVMPTRPGLLVAIVDTHGCTGWGEVWANFPPRANLHKAHLIEDVLAPKLAKFSYTETKGSPKQFLRDSLGVYFLHIGQERVFDHILAGLDVALWDLALRSAGRSFRSTRAGPPQKPDAMRVRSTATSSREGSANTPRWVRLISS